MKSIQSNIKKAKKYLDNNHCIAVPTETVYGLAGNAYSDIAVKKIFKLDPKTGKVRRVDPKQERGNRDVILYHDHGHGEHGEHDNYKHGKGVEMGSYSAAQPIDIKRNYRFEYETEAGKNVDMNHVRDQRLSNY